MGSKNVIRRIFTVLNLWGWYIVAFLALLYTFSFHGLFEQFGYSAQYTGFLFVALAAMLGGGGAGFVAAVLHIALTNGLYVIHSIPFDHSVIGPFISVVTAWGLGYLLKRGEEYRRELEELRRSDDHLQALVDNTDAVIMRLDRDGNILYSNISDDRDFPSCLFERIPEESHPDLRRVLQFIFLRGEAVRFKSGMFCRGDIFEIMDHRLTPVFSNGNVESAICVSLVVTERTRWEDQIRENRERLDLVIQATGAGLWDWNIATGDLVVNERWAGILGYTLEELSPLGIATWMERIHERDRERMDQALMEHFTGMRDVFDMELRMRHSQGRYVWVYSRGMLVKRSEKGEPVRMTGTLTDISDRKKAERQLLRSNEMLDRFFDQTQYLVAYLDPLFNFIRVNRAYAEAGNRSAEEYIGKHHFDLYPDSENEEIFRNVLRTGEVYSVIEKLFFHLEKPATWWDWSLSPVFSPDGTLDGLVLILLDVTERVHSRRALERSEEEKRTILNSLENAVVEYIDRDMNLLWASDSARRYLAEAEETSMGGKCYHLLFDREEACDSCSAVRALETGEIQEMDFHTDDGKYWMVRSVPIIRDEGYVESVVHFGFDVTRLKKMEEEIRISRDRAEEASRAKSDFLANMSHEIRTPMNSIVGMIDLALMTEDSTEEYEYLTTARESARYLLGVISDILDISRIEAGRFKLEEDRVQPLEVAESAGRMLRPMADEKGLKLIVECIDEGESECPPMITDRGRLRQVMVNLLNNALKFTEEGEVRLNIGPRSLDGLPEFLRESIAEKQYPEEFEKWLFVSVSDTGIGITLEQQKLIFEQFQQVEAAMSRRYGGTGLGLAISRQLVERMEGVIGMESFPGQGSTFAFAIPWRFVQEKELLAEKKDEKEPIDIGSLHVLLAEDNPVNVRMAKVVLEKLGHHVRVAENGEKALEALVEEDFDLVLMDIEMPILNGIEATEKIRRGETGDHNVYLPIIAMTAHAISEVRERCMKAGMNGYITKPVDITRMQTNIMEILTDKEGTFSWTKKGRIYDRE